MYDELIEAIVTLMNVQSRYNKEVAEFERHSWNWYAQGMIEELDDAKENTKNLMNEYRSTSG